ncbi:DMT family transporter [Salipiger sp. PrR003]|uniref:DMT family transporter n=1 Tax=Salipiger sp. PrR003 TaxID=2706776 RepID=UPI0013D9EFE7|nr:DMT family transporter [Salipiger sp. PrR003]NDV52622.1 DMT family transporter [Salipiger sp. PrR003]
MMRLAASALFVFLWSTGFIGAKYGLPHAEPMTFVALRFGIVTGLVILWAFATRAKWPAPRLALHAALIGILMHAGFMGTTFVAISRGVEAGTAALIAALQPILSALLAWPLLGEKTRPRQWVGLCLGLVGVLLVVGNKLTTGLGSASGYGLCVVALGSLSFGTIWQKKVGARIPVASGYVIQYVAATTVTLGLALTFETMRIEWSLDFVLALTWLILAISIGAIVLLYRMLRTGAAARVSSLFFLTPASTALIGWAMFGEQLSAMSLVGVAIAGAGVFIAARN